MTGLPYHMQAGILGQDEEDRAAFDKYWAPASHEDIGLFWNQSRYNKLK